MTRLFGTDGIRGVANVELTPDLAYKVGWAAASVLAGDCRHKPNILVGNDSRISCSMLESALAAGLCTAGANPWLAGVVTTPAVAWLTQFYRCDAGIMISASHNPFEFNGIKLFNKDGYKLPDKTEDFIEALIETYDEKMVYRPTGDAIGCCERKINAAKDYADHLKGLMGIRLNGIKIALDCANGASSDIAPGLFRDLGASVVTISAEPDGTNINANCGSLYPDRLCQLVCKGSCDIGFAFDGDADRVIAVDENGCVADGDVLLAVIGADMKARGELRQNTIVATVMSNLGLEIMASNHEIEIVKTKVGDRYVLEEMLQHGYVIGGEQSGHIILLEQTTTGDGLLSALRLLYALYPPDKPHQPLSEARKIIRSLPQVQISARVPNDRKHEAMQDEAVRNLITQIERELDGKGRVLVRPSGTEPVIRVMIEGEDKNHISSLADRLAAFISDRFGN